MRDFNKNPNYQGFTMVELLITIVVAGVLLGIAAPNFSDAMLNSRQVVKTNELMGALKIARSEAIKRSTRTAVCARGDDDTCGDKWSNGFLVFVDNESMPGVIDSGEEILRVAEPIEGASWILNRARLVNTGESPLQRPFIRFGPRGTSNWRGSGFFMLCDGRGDQTARALNISLSGDPRRARREDGDLINSFGGTAQCGKGE